MFRVLWFTNAILPEAASALGIPTFHKAGWLEGYLTALRATRQVSLCIATRNGAVDRMVTVNVDGVDHIVLPCSEVVASAPLTTLAIREYRDLITAISPDLVHFHGSEYHYGLLTAQGHITLPAVLSIQGLMGEYRRVYFGGLSPRDILRAHTPGEIVYRSGIWGSWREFGRRATMEQSIIQGIPHIIGRTRWDRAHVREINPLVRYYHCDEIMRPAFYRIVRDNVRIQHFSIFVPTASYPLKGFHWLLKAVALLKDEFHQIRIRLADSQDLRHTHDGGYCRFLSHLIQKLGLINYIDYLGMLDSQGMAEAMATSHVFVAPSLIENSPNSLAEAMLVGVPCIVSLAGGMTSMVKDQTTALCFPPGDYAMLAECIRMLFVDDALARRLAHNAQEVARRRHDYMTVGKTLVSIYRSVLDGTQPLAPSYDD